VLVCDGSVGTLAYGRVSPHHSVRRAREKCLHASTSKRGLQIVPWYVIEPIWPRQDIHALAYNGFYRCPETRHPTHSRAHNQSCAAGVFIPADYVPRPFRYLYVWRALPPRTANAARPLTAYVRAQTHTRSGLIIQVH
jgi:hypothetical protein